jgi:hypothetical protein
MYSVVFRPDTDFVRHTQEGKEKEKEGSLFLLA